MTREEMIKKIIEFFNDNDDTFIECIEELDGWDGYLGDNRWYSMDELGDLFAGSDSVELLNRAYFGRDDDDWHTDKYGEKHYNSFNPNREYFSFDGYANLVSSNFKDYSAYLDEYFVEKLLDEKNHLYLPSDFTDFLEDIELEYLTSEEEEEEC